EDTVALRRLGAGFAEAVGARRIGVVPGFDRAADVDHDHVAAFEAAVRHFVVRVGAVRPGTDDDELGRGVAFVDYRGGDVVVDLALCTADPDPVAHAGVYPVDRGPRATQGLDLLGVFDHPQLAQGRRGQLRGRADPRRQRHHVQCGQRRIDGEGDRPGIRAGGTGAHDLGDQGVRVD